jgi:SAM-dependent methyltransferase
LTPANFKERNKITMDYAHNGSHAPGRKQTMTSYDAFGKFYDAVMGDRSQETASLRGLIREASPKARSVLELGCGTGSVLKELAKKYEVSGVDLSEKMLSIAKKKVPQATLFHQNMMRFRIAEKFDVICCVFDSINHVLTMAEWTAIFANVHRHLNDGGIFIFDINTQAKLNRVICAPPWVHGFGKNLLIITVTAAEVTAPKVKAAKKAPNPEIKVLSNWNIKVFEAAKGNRYLLHEEDIKEAAFPTRDVVNALGSHFRSVRIIDMERRRPSPKSERLYFVSRK